MEGVSWSCHKYLFHGPLWFIHKSHHEAGHKVFEFNDVFGIFFSTISILLMYFGRPTFDYRFWIGTGIAAYGAIYFILHDIFVHNRIKTWQTKNNYLLRLRRAHKMHHKSMDKLPSESYGLLYFSKKYKV
jgi:beta-carotene 3-hydroxylase